MPTAACCSPISPSLRVMLQGIQLGKSKAAYKPYHNIQVNGSTKDNGIFCTCGWAAAGTQLHHCLCMCVCMYLCVYGSIRVCVSASSYDSAIACVLCNVHAKLETRIGMTVLWCISFLILDTCLCKLITDAPRTRGEPFPSSSSTTGTYCTALHWSLSNSAPHINACQSKIQVTVSPAGPS